MSLDALTKQLGIYSGVVSIEEQEINIELNIESDEDGVPIDTTASPEAEILDAQEDESALDETEDAQEDLEEAHDALEALAISIEQYRLSGGMSPAIAEEKYKQLDLITGKWGSLRSTVPSVESFGLESSQMSAVISLENAAWEAVKRFWKTIVDTVTKWIEDFRTWITKITNVGTRLIKRAEKVKKSISDMKTDPSSKEAEGRMAAKVFVKDGTVVDGISRLYTTVYKCFDGNVTQTSKIIEALLSNIKSADKSGNGTTINAPGIGTIQAIYAAAADNSAFQPAPGGLRYKCSKGLPGGKVYGSIEGMQGISKDFQFTTDNSSVKQVKEYIGQFHVAFPNNVGKEALAKAKVKYLNQGECGKACDKVIDVAKLCEAYKTKFLEREKVGKSITELAKEQMTKVKESDDKNNKDTSMIKVAVQIAQTTHSRMVSADKTVLSNAISISHNVLDFVVASVNAGKKEEDKKEEKKTDDKK